MSETWITIKKAAELTKKSKSTICGYINSGYIRSKCDTKAKYNPTIINKEDLECFLATKEGVKANPYSYAFKHEEEHFKLLPTLCQGKLLFPKHPVLVGDKGTIFNTVSLRDAQGTIDTNGHRQIYIDGKLYHPYKLVSMIYCPNARFAQTIHHLDRNPINDKSENLLPCFDDEHRLLHDLMDEDLSGYWEKVDEIKKLNEWKDNLKYPVVNLESSDDNWLCVYFVNWDGFQLLLQGFDIDEVIRKRMPFKEYGCINSGKKSTDFLVK